MIQSPGLTDTATMKEPLTIEQRVFGAIYNFRRIIETEADLNTCRERLRRMLDNALSWDGELISVDEANRQLSAAVAESRGAVDKEPWSRRWLKRTLEIMNTNAGRA